MSSPAPTAAPLPGHAPPRRDAHAPAGRSRQFAVPAAVAACGLGLSLVVGFLVESETSRSQAQDLEARAASVADSLALRVEQHVQALIAARALIDVTRLDRGTWRNFVVGQGIEERLGGLYGLAWTERVDRAALDAFEATVAAEYPDLDFAVRPHPAGPGRAPDGEDAYVIRYHEPLELNLGALGLDLATSPSSLEGMRRARDSGLPALSRPMRLAQEEGESANKLALYVPVYATDDVPRTVAQRRAQLRGWIAGPLDLQGLFHAEWSLQRDDTAWTVDDLADGVTLAELTPPGTRSDGGQVASAVTTIGGRQWLVSARVPAHPITITAALTVLAGAALSFALAATLAALDRRRARPAPQGPATAQHARLQDAFDQLCSAVAVVDADGTVVVSNRAWRREEGVDEGDGGSCAQRVLERCADERRAVASGERPSAVTEITVPFQRLPRHFRVRLGQLAGGAGSVCVAIEDITLRRHAEQQLWRSRNMLEATAAMSQVGGWEYDVARSELHWADEVFGLHDLPLGEQPGLQDAIGFFGAEAQQAFTQALDAALVRGEGWDLELPLVTARGSNRWVRSVGRAERVEGRTVRVLGSYQDITTSRLAAERLRLSEERFRLIAEHATDGIWDRDLATGREYLSPSFKALFGYADHELPNAPEGWQRIIVDEDRALLEAAMDRSVERGEAFAVPVRYRHANGSIVWVICRGQTVFDDDGTPVRMVGTHTDITPLKRAEAQLEQAREEAEAGSRAKSEFLANMSHEIRTPMTAILGYVDLLASGDAPAEQCGDFLRTIERNGRHLLEIIDDILDLSKIEAGRLAVGCDEIDPARVLAEVRDLMSVRASGRDLELRFTSEGALPPRIESDALRLRQILLNLVGNAIKFTERGSVTVRARYGTADDRGHLQVEVIDTGIGIEPRAMDRLFSPFTQADDSHTRTFGGTGLGLTISQRLAHMLGGDIAISSVVGRGSTFTLTVDAGPVAERELGLPDPAEGDAADDDERLLESFFGGAEPAAEGGADVEATPAALPSDRARSLEGVRVLVAEDGPDNRRLVQLYLQRAGAEVALVENGQEAVERLTGATRERFDALLLDMQMPVLDGYGAARALRGAGLTLPIVALTAHAMDGDREQCLEAGCDDYATKPIDPDALIATLERVLRGAHRRAGA